jgi:hypothetical protein
VCLLNLKRLDASEEEEVKINKEGGEETDETLTSC